MGVRERLLQDLIQIEGVDLCQLCDHEGFVIQALPKADNQLAGTLPGLFDFGDQDTVTISGTNGYLLVKKLETGHYLAIKVDNDVNLGKVRATFHESAKRLVALLQ